MGAWTGNQASLLLIRACSAVSLRAAAADVTHIYIYTADGGPVDAAAGDPPTAVTVDPIRVAKSASAKLRCINIVVNYDEYYGVVPEYGLL